MDYNWSEILKSKETKDVYEIYIGKAYFPGSVRECAKHELISRDFNFDNIEMYKIVWSIASLKKSIRDVASNLYGPVKINMKNYLFVISGVMLIILLMYSFDIINSDSLLIACILCVCAVSVGFIEWVRYNMQKRKIKKYKKRIFELYDQLKKYNDVENINAYTAEIGKSLIIDREERGKILKMMMILNLVLLLLLVIRFILKQ